MGLGRFELPTSPLSGVRSNQLSYRPADRSLNQADCVGAPVRLDPISFKGGDPAAGSPTATLLRLHPSHESQSGERTPEGYATHFLCNPLPWCDGRCVQGPGTYSPRHSDPRLLAIPTSWSRVADSNPDYERFCEISSPSRVCDPLYRPL